MQNKTKREPTTAISELLELAAKAAGLDFHIDHLDGTPKLVVNGNVWNPLVHDGDALRLAVKLRMSVEISAHEESTYAYAGDVPRVSSCVNWSHARGDEAPATRRAITQAAAEIVKATTA